MTTLYGTQWIRTPAGTWVQHRSTALPYMREGGNWVSFGNAWKSGRGGAGGLNQTWTKIFRAQTGANRVVSAGFIPRSFTYANIIGYKKRATWVNDTANYTISFQLRCVQDPTYDFAPVTLGAGVTTTVTQFPSDGSWSALGYTWQAFAYYQPDGDLGFGGTTTAPPT